MRYLDQKGDDIVAKPCTKRDIKLICDNNSRKRNKKQYNPNNIYYADFETCKRPDGKGVFYAFEFMLCVQSMNGNQKQTFVRRHSFTISK